MIIFPMELRRPKRGCRAGLKCLEKKRHYKPPIPSVIMENVRSLTNKMEELSALTRLQRRYRECSLVCVTETWLNELTLDSHVTLDGFTLMRADRGAKESGKTILAVNIRPFYLLREFSHVIAMTVYIPPLADAASACELLLTVVSQLQTSHLQALLLITGDFNHASLSSTLPTFTQYVNCHTRDNRTLNLFYADIKDAYKSIPLPPLDRSDHNLVHLTLGYIPLVNKQPPTKKYVRKWSDEASMALKDCFV